MEAVNELDKHKGDLFVGHLIRAHMEHVDDAELN
jgi:hypothetical protein